MLQLIATFLDHLRRREYKPLCDGPELIAFAMGPEIDVESLLLRIVNSLVGDTKEVQIESIRTATATMFKVAIAPTDVGKVIGKQGRTARAIRILLIAIRATQKTQYELDIVSKS